MNLDIHPGKVLKQLLILYCILLCGNITGIVSTFYFGHDFIYGLVPLFNFDTERSIPTFYSTLALVFSSVLLLFIALTSKQHGKTSLYWLILSVIFLFLSIDEMAGIHEKIDWSLSRVFNTTGLLYYVWVVPYGIAVMVFGIAYIRFLMILPARTRNLFIVSGTVFVAGAIGIEALSGMYYERYGHKNLIYSLLYTCEESFEMIGVIIFNYSLLAYVADQDKYLTINFIGRDRSNSHVSRGRDS
ncbi:MAG: hypothetical protein WBB19_15295 [Desulforhopalus sp.]